ncbi:thioredoxin-like [Schistocerca americana]|uniref:thioredoxin-like n=1 Tax=Schistocerca americana TaxID=7009 RepID=UPI001F500C59|nr:thioredoxin-like [Schistocerca americana]
MSEAGKSDSKRSHVQVTEISNEEELATVLEDAGDKLVVIDFFADWCFPCKLISPFVLDLARTHTDVIFVKVDIDESDEIVERYEIRSIPAFVFIKSGRKLDSITGANYDLLTKKVAQHKIQAVTEEISIL